MNKWNAPESINLQNRYVYFDNLSRNIPRLYNDAIRLISNRIVLPESNGDLFESAIENLNIMAQNEARKEKQYILYNFPDNTEIQELFLNANENELYPLILKYTNILKRGEKDFDLLIKAEIERIKLSKKIAKEKGEYGYREIGISTREIRRTENYLKGRGLNNPNSKFFNSFRDAIQKELRSVLGELYQTLSNEAKANLINIVYDEIKRISPEFLLSAAERDEKSNEIFSRIKSSNILKALEKLSKENTTKINKTIKKYQPFLTTKGIKQTKNKSKEKNNKIKNKKDPYVVSQKAEGQITLFELLQNNIQALLTGKTGSKTDVKALIGSIDISLEDESKNFSTNVTYENYLDEAQKHYDLLLKARDEIAQSNNALKNIFIEDINIKEYNTISSSTKAFSGGKDYKLTTFIDIISKLYGADANLLISLVINAANGAILEQNRVSVQNFLATFATTLMFSDGYSLVEVLNDNFKQNSGAEGLHFFSFNGVFVPASFIMKNLYDSLKGIKTITNGIKVYIDFAKTNPIGIWKESVDNIIQTTEPNGTRMEAFRNSAPERWKNVSDNVIENTMIKISLMNKFYSFLLKLTQSIS